MTYDELDIYAWKGKENNRTSEGEHNRMSKITREVVLEIRRRYTVEDVSYRSLAADYDLAYSTVADIIRGRRWGSVK